MKRIIVFTLALLLICSTVYAITTVKVAPMTYSVASTNITVTTTATLLPTTALAGRESVALRLDDTSDTIYIGGSDVTATNGFQLDSSVPAITLDADDTVALYGIVSTGTAVIKVLEAK